MNKGNLNKLVTNYPVELTEEEIANLSGTLAPVIAACGGGGGGTGGKIYTGVGFVTVNNTTNQIGLTNEANTKINQDIPSAVSSFPDSIQYAKKTYVDSVSGNIVSKIPTTVAELTDSANYQTVENMANYYTKDETSGATELSTEFINIWNTLSTKQNPLVYGLTTNNEISSIGTTPFDKRPIYTGPDGVTGDYYSASNPSGFINSTQAETQILAKHYITSGVSELDNFYSKTDTSSKTELQTKFDSLLNYNVTAAAGIEVTTATDAGIKTFGISMTAEPVVTDTRLSGYNGVAAALDTNVSGLWNVGLTHDMLNTINGKLDTTDFNTYTGTTAPATYQPKGDYLSSNALEGYATQQWVGQQGYIKQETDWTNTIQEASAKAYNDATANANSLYQAKGDYVKNTDISLDANNKITAISGKELIITAHQSLTDYYTKSQTSGAIELSTEFGKYALKSEIPTVPTKVSDLTDSANYYKTTETSSKNELSTEFAKYLTNTQYNTDSATFALKTDLNDLVSSAGITTTETDYVMTTTGWKVLTLPGGGMTQVIHDDTLTGQGNADNSKLGLSQTAYNAITSVSSKLDTTAFSDVSGTFLTKSSADEDYAPISITTNVNTLTAASASWNEVSAKLGTAQYATDSATFVTKPDTTQTVLNNNYLIYSTLTDPTATTGWMPLSANYYSKTESDGRYQKKEDMSSYLTTAKYETDSATFVTSSSNTITGTKQYALTTTGWASVETAYLPLSGGTVSGELVVSAATGSFDNSYVKCVNNGNDGYARFGVGSYGGAVIKAVNGNNNVQVNVKYNTNNNELIQVQKGGSDVGFLIPAQIHQGSYTPTSADGILHIVLES